MSYCRRCENVLGHNSICRRFDRMHNRSKIKSHQLDFPSVLVSSKCSLFAVRRPSSHVHSYRPQVRVCICNFRRIRRELDVGALFVNPVSTDPLYYELNLFGNFPMGWIAKCHPLQSLRPCIVECPTANDDYTWNLIIHISYECFPLQNKSQKTLCRQEFERKKKSESSVAITHTTVHSFTWYITHNFNSISPLNRWNL